MLFCLLLLFVLILGEQLTDKQIVDLVKENKKQENGEIYVDSEGEENVQEEKISTSEAQECLRKLNAFCFKSSVLNDKDEDILKKVNELFTRINLSADKTERDITSYFKSN